MVFVFFAVSGFLITQSLDRGSPRRFVVSRTLRLFPGLAVSLLLVIFVMGPLVTETSVAAYLADPATWTALVRNLTLAFPQYTLPGVFDDNPYPSVQGSIWTLIYEVICYAGVLVLGLIKALRSQRQMSVLITIYAAVWLFLEFAPTALPGRLEQLRQLSLPFAVGIAFYIWRDRIILSVWLMGALLAVAFLARESSLWEPMLILALAYATFWLAYVPAGPIRLYNRVGDYSYGTYIYAFPLQGLAAWFLGGEHSPALNITIALPMTLFCAVLSWHLIEKPALVRQPRLRMLDLGLQGNAKP
jgi:peptidoglycan/LPS O-acetylase OafA/YrhL